MGYEAIAPYFVCMAVILALASSPLLACAGAPPSPAAARVTSLDGMRGFLALAVFFHHGAVYHRWLLDHVWDVPPSRFYTQIGQSGVAFFFMITGYLFWGRLLRAGGRIDFRALYLGRIFRIAPLYLGTISIMLAIVFWRTGISPREPCGRLLGQVGLWLALGFFGNGPDVNLYPHTGTIIAAVAWSLRYEWWFYLSLIVTSLVARLRSRHDAAVMLAYGTIYVLPLDPVTRLAIAAFLCGMFTASLEGNRLLARLPDGFASALILAVLAYDFHDYATAYQAIPVLLLGLCFYLIVSGASVFGLLTSRAASRLGDISYGIYLLQGLVLFGLFSIPAVEFFALSSPLAYWAVLLIGGTMLVLFATAAHVTIERPGIAAGKRLVKWLAAAPAGPAAPPAPS